MGCLNPSSAKQNSKQLAKQPSAISMLQGSNPDTFPSAIQQSDKTNSHILEPTKGAGLEHNGNVDNQGMLQDQEFEKSHIATSKVYRKSSSLGKKSSGNTIDQEDQQEYERRQEAIDKNQIFLNVPCLGQLMEGVIREELRYSQINIYTPSMAMEFTIPKSYAGPLIIPYMNYQQYLEDIMPQ